MVSSNFLSKATKLLLRSGHCNFRRLPTCSFHGIMPSPINQPYHGNDIDQKSEKHPFQSYGPRGRCLVKRIDKGLLFWLDMPGVGKNDAKVWVENKAVFYKGKAPRMSAYEDGRVYDGHIKFVMGFGEMKDIAVVVKNGVVRVFIPYYSDEA